MKKSKAYRLLIGNYFWMGEGGGWWRREIQLDSETGNSKVLQEIT